MKYMYKLGTCEDGPSPLPQKKGPEMRSLICTIAINSYYMYETIVIQ